MNTQAHRPDPQPDAPATTIPLRRWSTDERTTMEVALRPRETCRRGHDAGHDVYLPFDDGSEPQYLGSVQRYTGSLDRKIPIGGRYLRKPGKRRVLWSAHAAAWDRTSNSYVSRADAIRDLLSAAGL